MTAQFDRHRLVWGDGKPQALLEAHVVIAGVGGLGCVVAEQLVRSGVGKLTLIDCGRVDIPDLGRQTLYSHNDLGVRKVVAAARRLSSISPVTQICIADHKISDEQPLPTRLAGRAVPTAYADCMDNFSSRFALERQIPDGAFLVHGGIEDERGQLTTVVGGGALRLKDIFCGAATPLPPIPVIPQCCVVVGGLQSLAVINNIWWEAGLLPEDRYGATYRNRLALIDLADGSIDTLHLSD